MIEPQAASPAPDPAIELQPTPPPASESAVAAPGAAVDALEVYTHCPGAIGGIVDWITATARRPNRVLALGAALTVVGTLIGRRVAGPTHSATHLYVVPVGPTGSGKQHVLDAGWALMRAAGAHGHIGPSEFISMPAVVNFIMRKPLALCLQDEYGAFLKRVTHKKASGFEMTISKVLRTLWATSFTAMATPEWANREMKIIQSPAISILGMSTPEEFHSALQGESVENGFLNRFLVLNSSMRGVDVEPQFEPDKVPGRLTAALRALYLWSGPQTLLQIDNSEIAYVPDVLPWADEQAATCYRDFEHQRDSHMDKSPELKAYIARAGEIAIRLATIRAAGRWGVGSGIDCSDMEWGCGLSWTAGLALAKAAEAFVPGNERSAFGDKILRLIRRRGTAKVRDIQMYLRGTLRSGEIKDLLRQFIEADLIEWTARGYRIKAE